MTVERERDFHETITWLCNAPEPWVRYNALIDLAGMPRESDEVQTAYEALQAHPAVVALIAALDVWPPAQPLGKAYGPKDAIWKLSMLADFGLWRDDRRIAAIAERVFAAQAEDGGFLHGGFDHTTTWHARPYLCITHVMTYAPARFGYVDDPRLQRAYASSRPGSGATAVGIATRSCCPARPAPRSRAVPSAPSTSCGR